MPNNTDFPYGINNLSHFQPVSVFPIVKNWCNPAIYSNNCHRHIDKRINENLSYDSWVSYPEAASVHLTVGAQITNARQPLLTTTMRVSFSPPSRMVDGVSTQFLEPYQDKMVLSTGPSTCLPIYRVDPILFQGSNPNRTTDHTYHDGYINFHGGIETDYSHAAIGCDVHSAYQDRRFVMNDFEVVSNISGSEHIHTLTQDKYYADGVGFKYDIQNPDKSMHRYAGCPDTFYTPSALAQGTCSFDTKQNYVLSRDNLRLGTAEINFSVNIDHRLVTMSMWRSCANHWFMNTAHLTYTFDVCVTPAAPVSNTATPNPTDINTRPTISNARHSLSDQSRFDSVLF